MHVSELLSEERILPDLIPGAKSGVLRQLAALLAGSLTAASEEQILAVLEERESLNSTAIGEGIAIPHGRMVGLEQVLAGFARSVEGVDFDSLDGRRTHIFFVILAPEDSADLHLKALAGVARILKEESFRKRLLTMPSREILSAVREIDGDI